MAITIQLKRDTASNWTSNGPTLAAGEFGFETDTGKFKVGDGSTAWASLSYFEPEAAPSDPAGQQGEAFAYVMGRRAASYSNVIDKYSFTSDGNATDVGDMPTAQNPYNSGGASATKGYTAGGYDGGGQVVQHIYGMPFAAESPISDVGDVHPQQGFNNGTAVSNDEMFIIGGLDPNFSATTIITKMPFSSEGTAADSGGDLNVASNGAGITAPDHAYFHDASTVNFYKFPFAISSGTSTDVGDLPIASNPYSTGINHTTKGYWFLSAPSAPTTKYYYSFPFASDANASCVGSLSPARPSNPSNGAGSSSSTTDGYVHGGLHSPGGIVNNIDKFGFSSEGTATDVGDLTTPARGGSSNVHV